jgi:hypothetical protein
MTLAFKSVRETLKTHHRSRILFRQTEDILQRFDAMPTLDNCSRDEILAYDDHGLRQ